MKKRIIVIFLAVCIALSLSAPALAADGDAMVYADNVETTVGGGFYLYVYGRDFTDVAALDVTLYYDASVIEAQTCTPSGHLSGANTDINMATPGEISIKAVTASKMEGNDYIAIVHFSVLAESETITRVTVSAGEAYDSSLSPVKIKSTYCTVKIGKAQSQSKYLDITRTNASFKYGENADVTFSITSSQVSFAAGLFSVEYDESLLRLVSADVGSELKNVSGAVYSINSSTPGSVRLSYAAPGIEAIDFGKLLTLNFEAATNESFVTEVKLTAGALYDVNGDSMRSNEAVATVTVTGQQQEVKLPEFKAKIEGYLGVTYSVTAPGETGLAAGDFTISYDKTKLKCVSVEGDGVVYNIRNDLGTVKFSYINDGGIVKDTVIVKATFESIGGHVESEIVLTGRNLVNDDFETISALFDKVTCSVSDHTSGDINGDGSVNNKDLTRLFQYLSGWNVSVDDKALDINGDSKVNNKDITRLFQYLSNWNVEIY